MLVVQNIKTHFLALQCSLLKWQQGLLTLSYSYFIFCLYIGGGGRVRLHFSNLVFHLVSRFLERIFLEAYKIYIQYTHKFWILSYMLTISLCSTAWQIHIDVSVIHLTYNLTGFYANLLLELRGGVQI